MGSKRSVKPQFDFVGWTRRLAECIELELLTWRGRMCFDRIRALAIDCAPWHDAALSISFLTDRERFDETNCGKWSIADWRMFDFTAGPDTHWPLAEELMRDAHEYYTEAVRKDAEGNTTMIAPEFRDDLVRCCAKALKSEQVAKALKHYHLAADFELYAGHPDEPDRNYCAEIS